MQVDPAQAARHPAVAEFVIEQLRNRCATLEAALQRQFADPMPPELVRAALATQPQALQHCADAI